jgi:type I restriction enzyme, S subunit
MNRVRLKRIVKSIREPGRAGGYLGLEHVESATGRLVPTESEEEPAGALGFKAGDVLYGKLRPYLRKVYRAPVDGRCSSEFLVLRSARGLDARFLQYCMLSDPVTEWAVANSDGAKMPRAEWGSIGQVEVYRPPFGGQRAIADYLDGETARLDTLIATKKETMRLARERFSAVVDGRTGQPGGPLVPIRRLVSAVTTGSRDWSDLVLDGDGYFIRATNLRRHSTDPDLAYAKLARLQSPRTAEARRAMLQPGDVLVCVTGYPGSVAYWAGQVAPAFVSQHVAALRPAAGTLGQWMAFALLAPSVQAQIAARQYGGTKQGLGLDDLKELRVALASPTQQAIVAAELADAQANMDALIADCDRQVDLLREKRQALITAAVAGQVPLPGAA